MKRLYELINLYYDTASTYKKLFCRNKKEEDKKKLSGKNELQKKIITHFDNYYNNAHFYSLLADDKETSLKNIEKKLNEEFGILSLVKKINDDIETNCVLSNIEEIYTLFYEVLTIDECYELVIRKYGNDYIKYWDLFLDIQKLEKDLLEYLKIKFS